MASTNFSPGTVIASTWLNDVNVAVYTTLPSLSTAIQTNTTSLTGKQSTSAKDTSGGYVGLTTYNINFKDGTGTYLSQFTNANTAARLYTFPDKDITVAGTTNETLIKPTIKSYIEQVQYKSGSALTVDTSGGTIVVFSTTANATVTLPTPVDGVSFTLLVNYGGAHSLTFTGGGTIKWAAGVAPTATSIAGKYDKYIFTCVNGATLAQDGGRGF